MLLSILIPSIPERTAKLASLLETLKPQVEQHKGDVEVLVLVDLRTMELGEKRNRLMQVARGRYLINLDDDDRLVESALDVLVPALREEIDSEQFADVIAYDQRCYLNLVDGTAEFTVRTSMEFENETPEVVDGKWKDIRRKPWHWCCWRTAFARRYEFKGRVDEDAQWLTQAWPSVTRQRKLDQVLHEYHFSATESLCPQRPHIASYARRVDYRAAKFSLSLADFKRCLMTVPTEVEIVFAGMAEPWLNQDTTEMVLHAAHLGHTVAVYTTTVGMS